MTGWRFSLLLYCFVWWFSLSTCAKEIDPAGLGLVMIGAFLLAMKWVTK